MQQDRVVVITGGSAGVGRATARQFADTGAKVAILARDPIGAESAAEELTSRGRTAIGLSVDVSNAAEVELAADSVEQTLGPIDVWVNNAMVTVFSPIAGLSAAEVEQVTAVTYLGTVNGTLTALRRMKPRDRGAIVQVGSALSYRSIPLQGAYCGAKHAMVGFTDSLRTELLHDKSNVRVAVVHLPAMNTPQFIWGRNHMDKASQPVPPIYQPEVAAEAIEFASRHNRREVWVGIPTVLTILGQRLTPYLLDRYLAANGYESQLTDRPVNSDDDNLFDPLEGDFGAHGPFDAKARPTSPQLTLNKYKVPLLAGAATGAAFLFRAIRN